VIIRLNLILIIITLIYSGCKLEKQPEYVDEKPPVQDNRQEESKKQDSAANKFDSINKSETENDKFAYRRNEVPVAVIGPLDASGYMGKYVIVKGYVADVYKSEKVAYLNFVQKFPENPFSAVIFANKFDEFGDIQIYSNKNVEVSGRISTFRGKPQMILDKPSQIKIVN